jgi:predicted ATP-dependent endonuclease of OLD family
MVIPYGCLATFNNHEYRIFLDGIGSTNEYSFVKNVVTEFETEIKSQNDSKSVFIKTLCVRLLINYLRTNLGNFNAQEAGIENVVTATLNEVFNEYKKGGDNIEDSTKKFFKKILSVKLNYHGESLTYNEKISRPSIKFINSLREIPDSWFQKDGSLYFDLNPKNKSIESRTKRLELWNRFLALYFQTSSLSYYINLEWRPAISSGEYSHLNMYSRIFSIKEQLSNGSEGIILFLDEAEVTLHPEIQKALVNEMSLFCENIFPDKWIHIIFASHSPILLSDVPRRNAIFLKRDEHSVSISKDETPTFGANIYSLYKHPFFLERGLLGTFAESKINSLIRLVEEKKYLMRN